MGRRITWIAVAAMVGLCACGGGVEITGTVTDAYTGSPLQEVSVSIWKTSCDLTYLPIPFPKDCKTSTTGDAVTDAQGGYRLFGEEGGRYGLGATLAGYDQYYTSVDLHAPVVHDMELMPSAPGEVTDFNVVVSGDEAHLTWTNPTGPTFGGVLVLRGPAAADVGDPPPEDRKSYAPGDLLGDAVVVYTGTDSSFIDPGLAVGGYAYVAFAYSPALRYSLQTPPMYAHVVEEPPPPP
jgi:hypothetical protein